MATTKNDVICIAPELSEVNITLFNKVLADVVLLVSSQFGSKRDMAQRYLTAHILTVLLQDSADTISGPIRSERAGQEEIEYSEGQISDFSRYDLTKYGQLYMSIQKRSILPVMVAI